MTLQVPEEFSLDIYNKVLHPIKSSSETTYEYHYRSFFSFINNKYGKNRCFPLKGIIEFFNYLANKHYTSSTLKGIRSCLREPLKHYFQEYDILEDPWINHIIKHVKCHSTKQPNSFPKWDLDLVIRMIRMRDDQSVDYLFKKILFIAFIACPYRLSEFKAISIATSSFSPQHIVLRPHPLFSSKNQTDTFTPSPIIIQECPEIPEICPVRLINTYINLTRALCADKNVPRPDQLWLNVNLKPLTSNIMRRWIREIIFLGDPRATAIGTHVHSVRSQVASHLLAAGTPIKEIISSMSWQSASTFSRYYARLGIKSAVKAVLAGHLPTEV